MSGLGGYSSDGIVTGSFRRGAIAQISCDLLMALLQIACRQGAWWRSNEETHLCYRASQIRNISRLIPGPCSDLILFVLLLVSLMPDPLPLRLPVADLTLSQDIHSHKTNGYQ